MIDTRLLAKTAGLLCVLSFSTAIADDKLKLLIIDGQNNHDWRSTTDCLRATLEATGRFKVTVSTAPQAHFPKIPHRARQPEDVVEIQKIKALFKPTLLEAAKEHGPRWEAWSPDFANADVVVLNYNGRHWPDPVRQAYIQFVKNGGGTVLVHAANNAFRDWAEFNDMIGMGWRKAGMGKALKIEPKTGKPFAVDDKKLPNGGNSSHGSKHPFQVTVRAADHPIMKGIPPVWAHARDELYHNMRGPVRELTILSSSYSDPKQRGSGLHEPMTWEVKYGKGRAIITSMGHLWGGGMARDEYRSLYCLGFQTILARSCEYAATGKVTLPIPAGFPGPNKPNPIAPHKVAWSKADTAPSAARLSMGKKKKANPYVMLTPAETLETFEVAPGFVVECFASEPMVQEPVLTVWDGDGAMYVAEMRSYMQDVDGKSNHTMKNGRIKRLVDTDGDGKADKATIFVDNLFLPRMILPLGGGWIAVRETGTMDVWAYRDTNGDGVHDQKKQLYKRGPVGRNNPDKSVEHQDSGLIWNIDNHIYITYNMERYRYLGGQWTAEAQRGHWTQWGLARDDAGDIYWSHNSGPLAKADLHPKYWNIPKINGAKQVPGEPIMLPPPYTPDFMLVKSLCLLNDRGGSAGAVRGFTSACGQTIYRSDKFPPDARGDYFVVDPTIHVVRQADIDKSTGLIRITKSHLGDDVPADYEFLRSSDINTRFVNTAVGPDGCLYVTDMYRGIIQDAPWLNPQARANIKKMGLDKNIQHGRIWRIRHKDFKPRTPTEMPPMSKEPTIALLRHLSNESGWWRDTAQREILLRKDAASVAPHLKALARFSDNEKSRLHALWTLEGLGKADVDLLKALTKDRSPLVRRAVVQIAEPNLAKPEYFEGVAEAMTTERDALVAKQLILSLGYSRGNPKAIDLIQKVASNHAKIQGVQVATTLALWGQDQIVLAKLVRSAKPSGPFDQSTQTQWKNMLANWERGIKFPDSVPNDERKRILSGQGQYFKHCISCHGADAKGVAAGTLNLAPSLVDSKRLKGDPQKLLPLFVNGLIGPIDSKTYASGFMAPAKALGVTRTDRLSELITYLRYVYGDGAGSVSKAEVDKAVKKYQGRKKPWTDQELKALQP